MNISVAPVENDLSENLIVGLKSEGDSFQLVTNISDDSFLKSVHAAFDTVQASTADLSVTRIVSPADSSKVVIGVGTANELTPNVLRNMAGAAIAASAGLAQVAVTLPAETEDDVVAIAEGSRLAAYDFAAYRKAKKEPVAEVVIRATGDFATALERAEIVATAVNDVRDLVNTAPNYLNPATFADIARKEAEAVGCAVTVYAGQDLVTEKLAGILHVGAGSASAPCLIRVEWNPENAQGFSALVGKGITFDSGGYSLKPSNSMTEMKTDMAGAATLLHTVIAAAKLGVPRRIVAWLCMAENMVSGAAGRPDDVITYRNGKSVEINNTDAEGRLVLADGLIMAVEENPDEVLDMATLTGAQMVALGERTTGVMGTAAQRDAIVAAADAVGEEAWAMPLPAELRKSLDSEVADLQNSGSRWGGMSVAGLFLQEFVGETPWAHIDIAGPSFNRGSAYGYTPKGATGCMLRAVLHYLAA
ncbi:MAG: leucyl aminopeptidase [Trueperella sp.]|nr:leucyl aminopeptidase [Trueperella sp.]